MKKYTDFLLYNIFNLLWILFIFREAFIIHSESGPSGFGELVLQIFILYMSIFLAIVGLIASIIAERAEDKKNTRSFYMARIAAILLTCFGLLMLGDACSDDGGYCRNWEIYFK